MTRISVFARTALYQSEEQLAAACEWKPIVGPDQNQQLLVTHRPTGIQVAVKPRHSEAKTKLIALVHVRNRCYDMLRSHKTAER